MRFSSSMNKKGDIPSLLWIVIVISVIGIIVFFLNHVTGEIYSEFDGFFSDTPRYNNSEAHQLIEQVQVYESSIWDYAFLFIVLGYALVLFFSSISTPVNPIFYWVYGIVAGFGFVIGAILSNVWQEFAASPVFATTITRFPITNLILGNFYPLWIAIIVVTSMVLLFGKRSENR